MSDIKVIIGEVMARTDTENAELIRQLKQRNERLERALKKIANIDYRGNRSTESQIAYEALANLEDE